MENQAASRLKITLEQSDNTLRAWYEPDEDAAAPDRMALTSLLQEMGWDKARLDEKGIGAFLLACHRAEGPVDGIIGEAVDGYFELEVDPDELAVRLTLHPPQAGRPVTPVDVRTALAGRGVKLPVDESALDRAFSVGRCHDLPIVIGTPPLKGIPAKFVNLLDKRREEADEHARIDLRDLGNLLLVQPGTPLMRRIPAVPGTAGQDVYGRVLAAPEAADTPFDDKVTGAAPDAQDPNLLIAAVAGLPSVRRRGVSVNQVVNVEAVDMHSGNIDFDGTLRVSGDIRTGMTVRVAGDVIVSGTIEAAHVECGGNVMVSGGIIGKSDGPHDPNVVARIECKGAVQARFIESAVVEAGGSVVVESGIRLSDVAAGDVIQAGDPATGAGSIVGGRLRAWEAVRTGSLGAPAGTATVVHVGLNPYSDAEKAELEAERQRKEDEQAKVQQVITFITKNPERANAELREKVRATLFKNSQDLLDIDKRLAKLVEELQPRPDAAVVIGKRLYGGVSITIGQKTMKVMEDMPGAELRIIGDGIGVVQN
ncbi:DUF342 domain-containing protein [Paracidovorax citrulli]